MKKRATVGDKVKAWFQRSKKYVSIVLVIILFCVVISILSIPYTKELIGLIKLSSPKISNAESVQVYTAIYMALTSFVGVFIGLVGIAGTLIIISMQHDQIKIQKDQLLDGETEARFEKNRLMNILKDERRRHEELIGIEKEKLRLGMVDSEIREAHRVIEMIEDLISDLSFFSQDRVELFKGKRAIPVWSRSFQEYIEAITAGGRNWNKNLFLVENYRMIQSLIDILALVEMLESRIRVYEPEAKIYAVNCFVRLLVGDISAMINAPLLLLKGKTEVTTESKEHAGVIGLFVSSSARCENIIDEFRDVAYGDKFAFDIYEDGPEGSVKEYRISFDGLNFK